MTNRMEKWLERLLNVATILLLVGGLALVYSALNAEEVVVEFKSSARPAEVHQEPSELSNEKIQLLAEKQMTRAVLPKVEAAPPKPPAPKLSSILKLKGIMDFGDPGSNEAILENLRTNQTRGYKAGQSIEGIATKLIEALH